MTTLNYTYYHQSCSPNYLLRVIKFVLQFETLVIKLGVTVGVCFYRYRLTELQREPHQMFITCMSH